jgi:hypothetical protein
LVSLALKQLLEAGVANVIPTNSDKLLSKIDIPEIPHPNPLPWHLGAKFHSLAHAVPYIAIFLEIM